MGNNTLLWIFNAFILIMLALDLGVFHRKVHEIKLKEALGWSLVWIVIALLFNAFVWLKFGKTSALEFLTGYIIEKSLSIDNIFVFVLIFKSFNVQPAYQHKVLFWGVTGALLMRAGFIFAGVSLIERFHWIIYIIIRMRMIPPYSIRCAGSLNSWDMSTLKVKFELTIPRLF